MRKLKLHELNRLDVASYQQTKKIPVVIVLDHIRSAMNVGAIFRSSDAFTIESIILTGITAIPPHREITKTAIGATNSVSWTYTEHISEALQTLRDQSYRIAAIEQTTDSIPLDQWKISTDDKWAIILGNEVEGVSQEALSLCDEAIEVPQYGTKHSLNVSVCAGIVIWELQKAFR